MSYSAASSPGCPAGAIQLAESFTARDRDRRRRDVGDRLADRHATRRRRVDQRERRALAHRHRLARVAVDSPSASPRQSATGTCHGPTIGSRAHQPADRAIADRDQEGLVGDRGQLQHAPALPRRGRCRRIGTVQFRSTCATSRVIFGGLPRSTARSMSTGSCRRALSPTTRRSSAVAVAEHGERTALARADRREERRALRARSRARSAPALRCTRSRAATCPAPRSGIARRSSVAARAARHAPARAARWTGRRRRRRGSTGSDCARRAASSGRSPPARGAAISALSRCTESKSRSAASRRRHRGRRAAAHTDQHAGTAELTISSARRQRLPCARRARDDRCRRRRRS